MAVVGVSGGAWKHRDHDPDTSELVDCYPRLSDIRSSCDEVRVCTRGIIPSTISSSLSCLIWERSRRERSRGREEEGRRTGVDRIAHASVDLSCPFLSLSLWVLLLLLRLVRHHRRRLHERHEVNAPMSGSSRSRDTATVRCLIVLHEAAHCALGGRQAPLPVRLR